jgi:hypothetical protein
MKPDRHKVFKHMIDESLAAGVSIPEEQSLREHLRSCVPCQDYLNASNRVIASLGGFSFEVDPSLQAKVFASISQRAQQVEATPFTRHRLLLICALALAFTAAGSFLDLQFGSLIASVFDIQSLQVRHGLIAFWIAPSLCLLLLFPILPLLSEAGTHRKERAL